MNYETLSNRWSKLVLYADGQLVVLHDDTYLQKMLTQDEIKKFFSRLDALGFYILESNQKHDPIDMFYNFDGKYEEVGVTDGLEYCILVSYDKVRSLCLYEPYQEYLIPQMKAILKFLDGYQPNGLSPYSPDRILLKVEVGRDPYDNELPQDTIPWVEPSLSLESAYANILYVEGKKARDLFALYGDKGHVVTQNGKEYTVYIRVVLPHEEITNIHDQ